MSININDLLNLTNTLNFGFIPPEIVGILALITIALIIEQDKNKMILTLPITGTLITNLGFNIPQALLILTTIYFIITILTTDGYTETITPTSE